MKPAVPTISLREASPTPLLHVARERLRLETAAEVRQLHRRVVVVALVDDVLRLHVQVVDVLAVECPQGATDASDHVRRLALGEALLGEKTMVEVAATHVFHDHVHQTTVLVDVYDAHQIAVVDLVLQHPQHRQLLLENALADRATMNHLHGVHLAGLLRVRGKGNANDVAGQTDDAVAALT